MKVVHFSTYDALGGAARAAHGIHASVLAQGCDSWMIVARKVGRDNRSIESAEVPRLQAHASRSSGRWPGDFFPDQSTLSRRYGRNQDLPVVPDIIHLHWIAGLLSAYDIRQLWMRYRTPIVWTIMDMAPLTGGCHYSHGCDGFTAQCGLCPQLGSHIERDISRRSWLAKNRWLREVPITFVGATQWPLDMIARSSLFKEARTIRIPYGIDDSVFRPRPQAAVRKLLNLPRDARIVFFGATNHDDERKGMKYMVEALRLLPELLPPGPPLLALIAGGGTMNYEEALSIPCVSMGRITNDRMLAMAYQSADVFVCPSVEDSGPLMMPEALMCGTPVVAFDACGGAPDLIRTGINGYLASMYNSEDLAKGIVAVLGQLAEGSITPEKCRSTSFPRSSMQVQGERYVSLYQELLDAC